MTTWLPGNLDQEHSNSSARPSKTALFCTPSLKSTSTMQKKAGNPYGLPAQGQCVSRHMKKSRVNSAFVPGGYAGLHPSYLRQHRAQRSRGPASAPPRALSGLRPRRTPMPERRLRPRERSCGQPQPSAEDGCSGRCCDPCQRRVHPCG